jgi:DMSO/TMAO reductase YedYZ molybdopterin-dependent catalytic subunit
VRLAHERPLVRPGDDVSALPAPGALVAGVEERFTSPLHSTRIAAVLGLALGAAFTICFATGLLTWWIQHPPTWFDWPSRPAGLYRVTQGVHVATGIAAIPLLLSKLWTVYPHFWASPPVRDIAHAVERLSLLPLVGGSLFLLFSGTANIALWYPWSFSFPVTHHWAAWITMGALVAHVFAKIHLVRSSLGRRLPPAEERPSDAAGLDRRHFLAATFGSSLLLTAVTVGQTLRPLTPLALLAPRRPDNGPQGFPVNKTAAGARVTDLIDPSTYRLVVRDGEHSTSFSLEDLRALPRAQATLPIACVEGWSASATWRGVRLLDVVRAAGHDLDDVTGVSIESLQPRGSYRRSDVSRDHLLDRDTLLALEVGGEPLHPDHGYPVRLIGPNRPGVLQTKWVGEVVVSRRSGSGAA